MRRGQRWRGIARRAVALGLSWVFTATTVWASAPPVVASPLSALDRQASLADQEPPPEPVEAATATPAPAAAFLCEAGVFGPKRYTRTTGAPNVFTDTVAVPAGVVSPYVLKVVNGEPDGSHRVSSATIAVNGAEVARPFDRHRSGFLAADSAELPVLIGSRMAKSTGLNQGDLVIIQIIESSSADKQATTEASHDSSIDNSVTSFLGLPLNKSSVLGYKIDPSVQMSGSSKFTGDGKTSRKGTLSAVVSARVVRVLPSGNYAVKGKKQIRVNEEEQYITVSGIIRPEDIMWNNSIMSTNIADLKVDYYGSGILGDQQSKGFLARAIDKIWPF